MIKASISKINSKKSRSFLFLTLELAEYPDGLAELSLLAEYHHGTRRVLQPEDKKTIFSATNKQSKYEFNRNQSSL